MDLSIISNNSDNSDNSVESTSITQNTELNKSVLSSNSQQSNKSNNSCTSAKTIRGIDECCICFHPLIQDIAHLECNHMFHFNCLSKWQQKRMTQNIICPICQQNSIIKTITSVNDYKDISHILNESKEQKEKILMANNKYTKFPGIDDMDHSIICCNIL